MTLPSSGPLSLNDIQGEFGGSNPIGINEYYAGGGLVPAGTSGTYGAVPTSGQISIQNFYGTSNFVPVYIEDVFSTWLYTGNGATQTITNGINLSGSGGMVWIKDRNSGAKGHQVWDTVRGVGYRIQTQSSVGQNTTQIFGVSSFNSNGFTLGSNGDTNGSTVTFASWNFRKQPKFFDIVTYTGTGSAQNISHNLGSTPGCIIVKSLTDSDYWTVWHRGITNPQTNFLRLNSTQTSVSDPSSTVWTTTGPTSTQFSVGINASVNTVGSTYIAYLYAHNAGGFGATGSDNVVSCGSFTTNSSGNVTVTLGYEPQWIMYKSTTLTTDWTIVDNMRGLSASFNANLLANTASVESLSGYPVQPTATGFQAGPSPLSPLAFSQDYVYIAIRRGPMKKPTSGTSVYAAGQINSPSSTATITTNFPVDFVITAQPDRSVDPYNYAIDRLRGSSATTAYTTILATNDAGNEQSAASMGAGGGKGIGFDSNVSIRDNFWSGDFGPSSNVIWWNFARAPSVFDIVCYTGSSSALTLSHNLGVAPELMFVKRRDATARWAVYSKSLAITSYLNLEYNGGQNSFGAYSVWNGTAPTSTQFSVSANTIGVSWANASGGTYVAYLFATCAGVSKVGSYTGTGATLTIDCGFTGGARFVLIKRTDSTGDWWVWDTTRGMVAGTDPRLALSSTAASANANWVYTTSVGFQIVTTDATVNASGGSYIFFAVA